MSNYLRQSTAAQTRSLGAFVDDVDFITLKTALTIANTDIKLLKSGGASVNKNAGGATHLINGEYAVTWNATDTDTVGELKITCKVAGSLVVFKTYYVLAQTTYDALMAVTPTGFDVSGRVDIGSLVGTAQSAIDLKDFADAGYDPVTNKVQGVVLVDTTTTNTDMRGTDGANTVVPDGAGTAPTAIENRQEMDSNSTKLSSILTDTGTTLQAELDAIQAAVITNAAGVDIAADIIAVKAETAIINTATALSTGSVVTDGGNSPTSFKTDLTETSTDHWKDSFLKIGSGILDGAVRKVTAYNGTTKIITVNAFPSTPADAVSFDMVNE